VCLLRCERQWAGSAMAIGFLVTLASFTLFSFIYHTLLVGGQDGFFNSMALRTADEQCGSHCA